MKSIYSCVKEIGRTVCKTLFSKSNNNNLQDYMTSCPNCGCKVDQQISQQNENGQPKMKQKSDNSPLFFKGRTISTSKTIEIKNKKVSTLITVLTKILYIVAVAIVILYILSKKKNL